MAKKTIKAQMKQRRDTKANWAATNPVLLDGELGIVSDDPNLYKVGDGATAWNALPFRGFDGTLAQELGTSTNAAISQKAVSGVINKIESDLYTTKEQKVEKEGADSIGVLRADGTINSAFGDWRTSDFQEISDNVSTLKITGGYPVVDALCGLALYDKDRAFIAALKADGTKYSISEFSGAKYFRYSWSVSDESSLYIGYNTSNFDNLHATVKEAVVVIDDSFIRGVLRTADASIFDIPGWYTSPFIPVSKATKIDVFGGYPIVDNLCGVITYDSGINKFIAHPGGVGIDLSEDSDIAFIRFSCQEGGYARIYGEVKQELNSILDFLLSQNKSQSNLVVVNKNGGGDYTSINSAINGTADGDTIIVMPGVYNEAVKLYNKTRHIIGTCRETCIITTTSQLRADCPFEITSGSIENITVIASADNAEIPEAEATITTKAYAVHIDARHDNPEALYIRNCKLISDWAAAVGIGCRYYNELHFENCEFITHESVGEQGAFLLHNDDFNPNQPGGFIEVRNCTMHGSHKYAMSIESLNNGAGMKVLFAGNTLWVGEEKTTDIVRRTAPVSDDILAGADIALHIASHGNNIELLNR